MSDELPKNYVYLKVEADRLRKHEACHIFDEQGNCLGILPALSVSTRMDYSKGYPITTIEIAANKYVMETHRRPERT
jgi:hypothetical protein